MKVFGKIFKSTKIILYSFDINNDHLAIPAEKSLVPIIRIADGSSVLLQELQDAFPEKEFFSRLDNSGWQCFVAISNDKIVAYSWVATEDCFIREIDYHYKLNSDEIFIYDCFVCKEYRGRGIYPDIISKIVKFNTYKYCTRNKVNIVYIGVESSNRASIRGVHKTGFREFNRVRYLQWRTFRQLWWQNKTTGDNHANQ